MQEESINRSTEHQNSIGGSSLNTFWNHYNMDSVTGLLKTAAYQLSSTMSKNLNEV